MNFHDYQSLYAVFKRAGRYHANRMPWREWYPMMFADAVAMQDRVMISQCRIEYNWTLNRQPYYNVWPAVIKPLTRLNLNLSTSYLKPPKSELLIRMPVERNPLHFDWEGDRYEVQTIIMAKLVMEDNFATGVGIWLDIGEKLGIQPILTYQNLKTHGENSLEEEITHLQQHWGATIGVQVPDEIMRDCLRLCCTLCLLENDPGVIEADVLNRDKVKFEKTKDQKFIDRAHRNGKVGWNIGRQMTVSPHYRIPHSALFWTGPGRTIPLVKIRAGSVVHRKKIEKIPTGHLMKKEDGE